MTVTNSTRFSAHHTFTRSEVEASVEATAAEGNAKRWLVRVTTAHRQNAIHLWALNQLAFWVTVPAIFLSEVLRPTVARSTLHAWLILCIVNWSVRAALYARIFRAAPAEVSRRLSLRLIPLLIMAISAAHWAWSVHLFITHVPTPTVLVMYVGFVLLTVASMGNLLATPVAAGGFVAALWLMLSIRTVQMKLMHWPLVLAIIGGVLVILWLGIHVTVKRLRAHLDRSDQLDLLLSELKCANAELKTMKDAAATILEKRSRFFAEACHDFKQRLNAMKLMTYSTVVNLPEGDRSRWALTRLSDEVQELESYISHFLAFTRIEALDQPPDLQDVRLVQMLHLVELRFEEVAKSRYVRLRFRMTRARVRADPRLLLQILENLVTNALKFTRHAVLVSVRHRNKGIAIEVWDQGEGIAPSQLGRIFDSFHQDSSATAQGERGVGLGLAIAKRFADRLGFTVTVQSRLGKGSVFRIEIPPDRVVSR